MWLDTFNQMRKESGMSLDELCEKSGIPKGTLAKITSGVTKAPSLETMRSLVYAMGYRLKDLDDGLESSDNFSKEERDHIKKYRSLDPYGKEAVDSVLDVECRRVSRAREQVMADTSAEMPGTIIDLDKIIPFRCSLQPASAGTGIFLGPEEFETIYIQKNDLTRRASFGVPVSGDSMEPVYHNGDILLLERAEDIRIGEVGVFTINGEGYVKERGDGELISLNPAYKPIPMNESIRCNGRVIGILDPDWIVEK